MAKKYENVEKITELLDDKQLGQLQKRLSSTEKNLAEIIKKLTALEIEKTERDAALAREAEEAERAAAQAAAEQAAAEKAAEEQAAQEPVAPEKPVKKTTRKTKKAEATAEDK